MTRRPEGGDPRDEPRAPTAGVFDTTRRTLTKSVLLALAGAAAARTAAARTGPQGITATRQFASGQREGAIVPPGQQFELVNTIAALKSTPIVSVSPHVVLVLGYAAPNDGGAGLFAWAPLATQAPDGGSVFESTVSPTGRWLRLEL